MARIKEIKRKNGSSFDIFKVGADAENIDLTFSPDFNLENYLLVGGTNKENTIRTINSQVINSTFHSFLWLTNFINFIISNNLMNIQGDFLQERFVSFDQQFNGGIYIKENFQDNGTQQSHMLNTFCTKNGDFLFTIYGKGGTNGTSTIYFIKAVKIAQDSIIEKVYIPS